MVMYHAANPNPVARGKVRAMPALQMVYWGGLSCLYPVARGKVRAEAGSRGRIHVDVGARDGLGPGLGLGLGLWRGRIGLPNRNHQLNHCLTAICLSCSD